MRAMVEVAINAPSAKKRTARNVVAEAPVAVTDSVMPCPATMALPAVGCANVSVRALGGALAATLTTTSAERPS